MVKDISIILIDPLCRIRGIIRQPIQHFVTAVKFGIRQVNQFNYFYLIRFTIDTEGPYFVIWSYSYIYTITNLLQQTHRSTVVVYRAIIVHEPWVAVVINSDSLYVVRNLFEKVPCVGECVVLFNLLSLPRVAS